MSIHNRLQYNRSQHNHLTQHNRSQVLEALCNRADQLYSETGLPFVTLTYAQSLDGSIAGAKGEPIAISCEESLVYTHALRACHDAILVGINTVLSDNPALSTRLVEGPNPRPVVLDSKLRISLDAQVLMQNTDAQPIIFTTSASCKEKLATLRNRNICVIELPADKNGWISIKHLLPCLGKLGIKTLMVEGGGKVITSFIKAQSVDHLIVTVSMKMIGGVSVINKAFSTNGTGNVFPLELNLSSVHWEGADMILHGDPVWQT